MGIGQKLKAAFNPLAGGITQTIKAAAIGLSVAATTVTGADAQSTQPLDIDRVENFYDGISAQDAHIASRLYEAYHDIFLVYQEQGHIPWDTRLLDDIDFLAEQYGLYDNENSETFQLMAALERHSNTAQAFYVENGVLLDDANGYNGVKAQAVIDITYHFANFVEEVAPLYESGGKNAERNTAFANVCYTANAMANNVLPLQNSIAEDLGRSKMRPWKPHEAQANQFDSGGRPIGPTACP